MCAIKLFDCLQPVNNNYRLCRRKFWFRISVNDTFRCRLFAREREKAQFDKWNAKPWARYFVQPQGNCRPERERKNTCDIGVPREKEPLIVNAMCTNCNFQNWEGGGTGDDGIHIHSGIFTVKYTVLMFWSLLGLRVRLLWALWKHVGGGGRMWYQLNEQRIPDPLLVCKACGWSGFCADIYFTPGGCSSK